MTLYYTGVGSRKTPKRWLEAMTRIAASLYEAGYTLRSGGADGADAAFAAGSSDSDVYIPWRGFNHITDGIVGANEQTELLASTLHPAWDRCSQGARKLHARNVCQVLGLDLNTPSEFLLCWTPEGAEVGGTATAIRLAKSKGITVYNFGNPEDVKLFRTLLDNI